MSQTIAFVNPHTPDYSALDLGLTYLATYLNQQTEHKATIIDLTFRGRGWRNFLRDELSAQNPDWVGLSTNKLYLPYAREVAQIARGLGFPVVVGGHQASVDPEGALEATGANAACTGDGESSLRLMLENQERESTGLPRYEYLERTGLVTRRIWHGNFIEGLDRLPIPDYSLWKDLDKYLYFLGSLYTIGSRGCPYSCKFCDAPGVAKKVGGRYFRLMSPNVYAWQLASLYWRHRPQLFQMFDPVLTMYPAWVEDFCAAYRELGVPVPFSAFARIDHLDERRIKALAGASCRILRVGIEAGDEHIRNQVYGKRVSNQQIREARRLCREHGIAWTAYLILGGPGETHATVRETVRLARELDCERQVFFIYKVLTDEGLEQARGCGAKIHLDGASNITFGTQLDLPGLPGWQVQGYQAAAYGLTFSRRLARLIRAQKLGYATRLVQYVARGLSYGLDLKYLLAYFQVYSGDNATS